VFEDTTCNAVDSGPDVTSRKAARLSGRDAHERGAIVIDRFFETKAKAMQWATTHPKFLNVWIVPPRSEHRDGGNQVALELNLGKDISEQLSLTGGRKHG
jgi:hypothetical protein